MGTQLEITRALRDHLKKDGKALRKFAAAVRDAIDKARYG